MDEESVKLREELDYTTFYPDLEEDAPLLLHLSRVSHPINCNDGDESKQSLRATHAKVPVKQILYKDEIKYEEIHFLPKAGICRWELQQLPNETEEHTFSEMTATIHKMYHKLSRTKLSFDCSYDLDTQDYFYLQYLSNLGFEVTPNLMEIIITILEIEWLNFESYIPQKVSNLFKQTYLPQWFIDEYGCDDGRLANDDTIDEQSCSVCDCSESELDNSIIFCDGCNIAVHQDCYGVVFIPEGTWYCRKCMLTGINNTSVACKFCPSTTGAFKQTSSGDWAHVLCGLWIPELSFANLNYMEPIMNDESIPKSRWRLTCFICGLRNTGCCIQCVHKNCFTAYHPTCAKRSGLFLNLQSHSSIKEAATGTLKIGNFLETYCPKHQPNNWIDCTENILKTRKYFKNETAIKQKLEMEKTESAFQKQTILQLRTTLGTPVAPPYFIDLLSQVLHLFNTQKDHEYCQLLSFLICKYWNMKKESLNGTLLLKNWKASYHDTKSFNESELSDQLEFMEQVLKPDLDRLVQLAKLLEIRTKLNLKLEKTKRTISSVLTTIAGGSVKKQTLIETLNKNALWKRLLHVPELSSYFADFVNDSSNTDILAFQKECSRIFKNILEKDSYCDMFRTVHKFGQVWDSMVNGIIYNDELNEIIKSI